MKKLSLTVLLLSVCFSQWIFSGCGRDKPSDPPSVNENVRGKSEQIRHYGNNGVSLVLPKGWSPMSNDESALFILGPSGEGGKSLINVASAFVGTVGLDDCNSLFLDNAKGLGTDFNIIETRNLQLLGTPSVRSVFTNKFSGKAMKTVCYIMVRKGWSYEFLCSAPAKDFKKIEPVFEQVMKSLQIKKQTSKSAVPGE